jgi:hypothetical protein
VRYQVCVVQTRILETRPNSIAVKRPAGRRESFIANRKIPRMFWVYSFPVGRSVHTHNLPKWCCEQRDGRELFQCSRSGPW